jgi:putative DNA primase/helicase
MPASARAKRTPSTPAKTAADAFRDAIAAAGLQPPDEVIADGKLHRFPTNGRADDDAGWYVFHDDGVPAGSFGDWRTDLSETWQANLGRRLTSAEKAAHRARLEELRRAREAEEAHRHADAREQASRIWNAATPATDHHAYLTRKQVRAYGLRVHADGRLIVPMGNNGELHSLQFIDDDGDKLFLAGGRVKGCYHVIGTLDGAAVLCIAEGYATGATIYAATGYPVAVAFNAGNFAAVAKAMRARCPELRLILCADDDIGTDGNPGLTKAAEAARAVGGWLAVPDFGADRPAKATDFNDLAVHRGLESVRNAITLAQQASAASETAAAEASNTAGLGADVTPLDAFRDVMPLDVFGAGLAGQPELPAELLPQLIADYAGDASARLGVDLGAVALPCIATAAAAIADAHTLQPREHNSAWTERPCLWIGNIADVGEKKTHVIGAAVDPLRAKEREWVEEDQRALATYQVDRHAYEIATKDCARRRAKGQNADVPVEPKRPPVRRRVVSDLTTEALAGILVDNPDGVLVDVDELSGWFASHDAYRSHAGKDRAFWLDAYEGKSRRIDRVGRGSIYVPNLSACIIGGIQPGPMRRLAGKITDDGLVQRFNAYYMAPSRADEDRCPDLAACSAYRQLISALVDMPAPAGVYTFSPEARVEHATVECLARRLKILPQVPDAMRGHLSKWPGMFARFALTFHLIETRGATRVIPGRTAAKVARLMSEVLLPHAAKFYGELAGEERWTHARWIAGYILAQARNKLTARDIGKHYRALRGDKIETARAMETLEAIGWVVPTRTDSGPPTRWRVNPRVHTIFARRAAEEREHRAWVIAEIQRTTKGLGLVGDREDDQ